MSDDEIDCEGHGRQRVAFACQHLAESQPDDEPIGFHWNCEGGDLIANCDDCEAEAGDDGFLPDSFFEENFVALCRQCFVEMAGANGVGADDIQRAEQESTGAAH